MSDDRPGGWPVSDPVQVESADQGSSPMRTPGDQQGEQHLELARVRARFRLVLDSIRADLREQPSEVSVRGAARRWTNAIAAMTDEVVREMRSTA